MNCIQHQSTLSVHCDECVASETRRADSAEAELRETVGELEKATALLERLVVDWTESAPGNGAVRDAYAFLSRAPAQPAALPIGTPSQRFQEWVDAHPDNPLRTEPAAPEPSADTVAKERYLLQCEVAESLRVKLLAAEAQLAAVNEVAQRAEKRVGLYPGLKGSTYYAAYLEILALLVRGATPAPSPGAGGGK